MSKIRWREHELVTGVIFGLLYIFGYWRYMYGMTPQEVYTRYELPFVNAHLPFNYYRNILLPHSIPVFIFLICLFLLNRIAVPRLLYPKNRVAGTFRLQFSFRDLSLKTRGISFLLRALGVGLLLVLFIFLIGLGFAAASYYEFQYLFNYPGFDFFPKAGYHPLPQIALPREIYTATVIVVMYTIYAFVREMIIWWIGRQDDRRNYRVMIANQFTSFAAAIILMAVFAKSFDLIQRDEVYGWFFACIVPAFIVFMSNMYWLFPLKGQGSLFTPPLVLRSMLLTFICTLLFFFPLAGFMGIGALLLIWLLQFLVVTPISWLFYRQRKDKILQLRGLEKALGRSRADLQFLRSQINPHFLFNTLNTLYGTALQEGAARTADGVQKLGDMMRFMLQENNHDLIPMDKEIGYLNNYISLQKLRTQSSPGISIEDNIQAQDCHHRIAPMLLIPFVENAFKHGISLREKSWIKIHLHCDEKTILFWVSNSVHVRQENDPEKTSPGVGMKNVLGRLKLLYPGKHELEIGHSPAEFVVKLSIQP
ncbi:MAG TPA: histidine kinase [Puia sp.]|nr:histidine kinase [Puia sp.]